MWLAIAKYGLRGRVLYGFLFYVFYAIKSLFK